jgi:hypothetical protein
MPCLASNRRFGVLPAAYPRQECVNITIGAAQCLQQNKDIIQNPEAHPNEVPSDCSYWLHNRGFACNGWENLDTSSTGNILSVVPADVYDEVLVLINNAPGVCMLPPAA